jgi:hypothetical protein
MDILLDNPLATMYGPYFLILYGSSLEAKSIRQIISRFRRFPHKLTRMKSLTCAGE